MFHNTPTHAHPVALDAFGLARIGSSSHSMRGIRYADGEGGAQPAPTPTPAPAPAPTPPAPAAAPTPPAPGPADVPKVNPATGQPYTPAETQQYIATLRTEAKTHREAAEARAAEAAAAKAERDKVLAALGLTPDGKDTPPDPAALDAALQTTRTQQENTARENIVLRVAPGLGANADRLLDSRSFADKLAGLKVDDRDGIAALVTEAIEKDPSLKTAPAPAAASGSGGHTGSAPITTRKSMGDAVRSRLSAGSSN